MIAGPLFEHFIVSNDLVLGFLERHHIAKLVGLRCLPLAYDFRVGFKQTQQFVWKLRDPPRIPAPWSAAPPYALDPPSFPVVPRVPVHPVAGGQAIPRLPAARCGNR